MLSREAGSAVTPKSSGRCQLCLLSQQCPPVNKYNLCALVSSFRLYSSLHMLDHIYIVSVNCSYLVLYVRWILYLYYCVQSSLI